MKETEKTNYVFETMPVPKALLKMAVPTIIGQIIVLIYNMADTFYVGKTDNPYMVAGVSLILPIFNILIALANLPGAGGGTYVSRLLGLGRREEAARVTSFSLWLSIGMAAVFSILVFLFMKPLLTLLGAGENTYLFAKQYVICVIVIGGVPTVLSNVLSNMLRSCGKSSQAGFGVAMGGILNIALDPLFMFVLLPEGQEILGVGIATCLSNMIACIYYFIVICSLGKETVIRFAPALPEKQSIREIFNVGTPAFFVMMLFDLDYIVLDKLMAGYSDISLAAIGIVLKGERLPLNIGVGICQGMVPLIAYNYSSKNYERMKNVSRLAVLSGIVCAVVSITLYEIFADKIIEFFIKDAETVAVGAKFLRARSPATLFMFLSFFTVHTFQAFGEGKTALRLGVQRWIGLNIPMLFILNAIFGMYGLVWAQLIADIINVVISFLIFGKYWKKNFPGIKLYG